MRWTRHGREEMEVAHQIEGSLHLVGKVVTPHQTKKKRGVRGWYSNALSYINSKIG